MAVLQVLVYAGAVMVLFLFIIMLLDVGPDAAKQKITNWKTGIFGFFTAALLVYLLVFLGNSNDFINEGTSSWPALIEDSATSGQSLPFQQMYPRLDTG